MKEQISQLANGQQLDHPLHATVTPQAIRESVAVGQNFTGELRIEEAGRQPMKGLVYSSHRRVRFLDSQFTVVPATVTYEVDTEGLNPGDQIEGNFSLVTGGGEQQVAFLFEMTVPVGRTAYEKIKSIEAFADLARQDYDVALKIFENSSFLSLPFMQQPAFAALYHGLYGHGERRGALEEFLTGCGAKEQLRLTVDDRQRYVTDPAEDISDVIRIEKNTWGAVTIRVRADAPFVELENRQLTEDSFEGDICELHYTVHPSMLHGGNNYGRITISTAYQTFFVEINVSQSEGAANRQKKREYRAGYERFFRYFVDVRIKDFRSNLLVNSMLTELTRLRTSFEAPDILELFHVDVCLMAGQRERAGLLLADVKDRILARRREEIDTYCYYYYLRTLYSQSEEDKEQLIKILRFYFNGEHPSQTVFFLLLLTDEERQENPLATLEEMKQVYARGSRSPFLYLAACRLYEKQPLLLTRIGDFEMRALIFGARHDMLGRELALRIALLAEEERAFRESYLKLLMYLARRYDEDTLVAAVCRVLIQGEKKGAACFPWYEKGVKRDVRLTRLYEYYLSSLPEDWTEELPQEIYLYFSYTNTLDTATRAVLYDNVLTHFAPESSVYDSFSRQMEEFAREQVFAGHMSRHLARIYEAMILPGMLDEKLAAALPRLLYAWQITCDNPRWEQVVLSYEEWSREETAVLRGGRAVVSLYSEHCRILFQDSCGNRYAGGTSSALRLMEDGDLAVRCFELCPDDGYLLMHHCRQALEKNQDGEEEYALYERVLGQIALRPLFARQLMSRILAGSNGGAGCERLLRLGDAYASREDMLRMLEIFIREDYCERAFELMERIGCEQVGPSLLLKLCSRTCVNRLFARDEQLLAACYYCMEQRRSDDVILEYLCKYYNGSSEQMLKILMKARQYHAALYDMPERLLGQMLFTGWREGIDDVFEAYADGGIVDEVLLRAYLVQKCYDFFTADVAAGEQVFGRVEKQWADKKLPFICRIALCRYLAYKQTRTREETALCMEIVQDCCGKGMIFDFFPVFCREEGYPALLRGQAIVAFRGSAGDRMRIRYRILPDSGEYRAEVFPHIYEGCFARCFTVFYGERLEYELYRERPEGLVKVAQGTELADEIVPKQDDPDDAAGRDRLSRLNHILWGMDTMDENALKKEMRSYGVAEVMLDHYLEKL